MRARITDASNCFNVNSLSRTDTGDTVKTTLDSLEALTSILEALDFETFDARRIAEAIADWVDPDTIPRPSGAEDSYYSTRNPPYLSANTPMADISELLAVAGISRETYFQIAPYLCARPNARDSIININTISADRVELLIPLFSSLISVASLRNTIERRSDQGFVSLNEFFNQEEISIVAPELRYDALMSLSSRYFELSGDVVYLDTASTYEALFGVSSSGEITMLRRQFG